MKRRMRLVAVASAATLVTGLVLASGIADALSPRLPPTTTTTTSVAATTTTSTTSTSTTSSTSTEPPTTEPSRSATVVVTAGCDGPDGFVEATVTAHVDLSDVQLELRRMFVTSEPLAVEAIGDMTAGSSATARWSTIGGFTYSVDVLAAGEFVHNSIDGMDACAAPPSAPPQLQPPAALPATR